uniref:Uncharacterized protein n=1 Tax=Cryptomonas curvata TaxID=233186 RepID=A0A6T8DJ53_9CRYP|mmetsp:Transcript_60187/g.125920  ORF Transcript_60187/g.125920 Transcript_60187/m.125920 type:complete len:114 (+) Transcript_60187:738-1079(+)
MQESNKKKLKKFPTQFVFQRWKTVKNWKSNDFGDCLFSHSCALQMLKVTWNNQQGMLNSLKKYLMNFGTKGYLQSGMHDDIVRGVVITENGTCNNSQSAIIRQTADVADNPFY